MKQNLSRLKIGNELDRFTPDDQNLLVQMKEIRQFLKQRRLVLGAVLVIMFVALPILGYSARLTSIEGSMTTLYESPPGGELLSLGSWTYGEVEVLPPPEGQNNKYQFRVEIYDWGSCPDVIEQCTIFVDDISIDDFVTLNETEKESLIGSRNLDIGPDRTVIGSGFISVPSTGTHFWALKFVPAAGYPQVGMLHISITIFLRAD
jgi:hypothetical protein